LVSAVLIVNDAEKGITSAERTAFVVFNLARQP
jgi:hypothetical protein